MRDKIITGLWQLAGGHDQTIDVEQCSQIMEELVDAGLTSTFDMADRKSLPPLELAEHSELTFYRFTLSSYIPDYGVSAGFVRAPRRRRRIKSRTRKAEPSPSLSPFLLFFCFPARRAGRRSLSSSSHLGLFEPADLLYQVVSSARGLVRGRDRSSRRPRLRADGR